MPTVDNEIDALYRRIAALEKKNRELLVIIDDFMSEQDSDWYTECGDWADSEEFSTEVPIGVIRRMDAVLAGK